jgi:hypothetical protein
MAPGLAAAELLLKAAQTREESDGRIDAAFDRIYSRSIGEAMGMLPDRDGPMSGASQKGEVSRAFRIVIFLAILAFATTPARAQGTWFETRMIRAICSRLSLADTRVM